MKQTPPLTQVQQTLVEKNLPLVHWLIRKHIQVNESVQGMGYDDIFQEGSLALCHAAATYRENENQFSTYASVVIYNHMVAYCRSHASRANKFPSVSLDASVREDLAHGANYQEELISPENEEDWNSRILVSQVLEHGKRTYSGITKLGVEALELKIQGYRGVDIAKFYDANPNHVFAWISRAQKRLREDPVACGMLERQTA